MKKYFSQAFVIMLVNLYLILTFTNCVSTNSIKNDIMGIPAEIQSYIGWKGIYSIDLYDGVLPRPNWSKNNSEGGIVIKIPAGVHTIEFVHLDMFDRMFWGTVTYDFQPDRIYNVYCRIMVSLNNIQQVSSVEFILTDVTHDNNFGNITNESSYRFAGRLIGSGLPRRIRTADGFFERGLEYYKEGDYELAISDFTVTIRLDPNFIVAYEMRGLAYFLLDENYEQAITDLSKVIDESFPDPLVFHIRGLLYFFIGDYDSAKADLTKVIELEIFFDVNDLTSEAEEYLEEIRQLQQ